MSEPDSVDKHVCVVLLTNTDGVFDLATAGGIEKRLLVASDGSFEVFRPSANRRDLIAKEVSRIVERLTAHRVLLTGCRIETAQKLRREISQSTGLAIAHICHIGFHGVAQGSEGISGNEGVVAAATKRIQRGIKALEATTDVETVEMPMNHDVVVLGDDACAVLAATEVSRFGFNATMISSTDVSNGGSFDLISQSKVINTTGVAGAFEVTVSSNPGKSGAAASAAASAAEHESRVIPCGAIIDTRGPLDKSALDYELRRIDTADDPTRVISLSVLSETVKLLPRISRERTIAIILDLENDETKASTYDACRAALSIQRIGVFQVHILCRHARIATPEINELYDKAREIGVTLLKYDQRPEILRSEEDDTIEVRCIDLVLKTRVSISCDLVAVSLQGLAQNVSEAYVNNLRFSPTHSSIPGYFLAGSATGEHYWPQASSEALAAALEVRDLLGQEKLEIELSTAVVDEEKCAICLTCIRTCPHLAMRIDGEKNIAANIPQSCQRCGICVGVCPARAISLPEYSEEVVMSFLD